MKALIQRVSNASVTVDNNVISSIGVGLCILIGISRHDTEKDMDYLVNKILKLKIFENDDGKRWASSVSDKKYEILCISQFTLYHGLKGNGLTFHYAMAGQDSEVFYNKFLQKLKDSYDHTKVKDGKFGAHMSVNIVNSGPVTIPLESPSEKRSSSPAQSETNKNG
uniref:D-aminoacyl-tRNA deacylase n=1 Tax=Cacopsylla melanoneura TaxID=428564 RepID=A0A8D8VFC3_9HEMI